MTVSTNRNGFVAVGTNPAIDRVARIAGEASGVVHATELLITAGGKAVHAACVAAELGARATVITTAGGESGGLLRSLLEAESLPAQLVPLSVSTRGTYSLVGVEGGDLVEVHEPTEAAGPEEFDGLLSSLSEAEEAGVVAVSGSLPSGAPTGLHASLIEVARDRGAFTILDCSTTDALLAGLAAGPDLVAPNLAEASALLETPLTGRLGIRDCIALASSIRDMGAASVWLTLGAEGSVLVTAEGAFGLNAPAPTSITNAVGCGDALVGGLAAGLLAGEDLRSSAALGAAAASDKLSHLHPGRVERDGVESLFGDVRITELSVEASLR